MQPQPCSKGFCCGRSNNESRSSGFTVLEVLIVLAAMSVLLIVLQPTFTSTIERVQLFGFSQKVVGLVQQSKSEAITMGTPVVLLADFEANEIRAFVDLDNQLGERRSDLLFNPSNAVDPRTGMPKSGRATDYVLARLMLPGTDGGSTKVCFCAADDSDPQGPNSVIGFSPDPRGADFPNLMVFEPDGSIREMGSLRIGITSYDASSSFIARDTSNLIFDNLMEIHVGPQATASVEVRKYVPEPEGIAGYYAQTSVPGGGSWTWY